jgi:uncharacterized NAD(P)/FAD-binding protein YdhS/glyoxylase-like metal-dependent hydrolase (beta-lactamase superfamily II)
MMKASVLSGLTPYTVAIIGGGFSGTMVAVHLLQNATVPLCIKLIEQRPEVGKGIAYSTSVQAHLLNVPAGKMSVFSDRPEHFLSWLKQQNQTLQLNVTASTFVPRAAYGDYVQHSLRQAVACSPDFVRLERVTAEAVAVGRDGTIGAEDSRAWIELDGGEKLYADQVVLALGNFPSSCPTPLQSLSDRHLKQAWEWDATHKLDTQAAVLLVGTGLTMVDTVITLRQQGHQGKIYTVSRHGLLPQRHAQSGVAYPLFTDINQAPQTVRALLRQVRGAIAEVSAHEQDWRAVIDSLRPVTSALWQHLPAKEQQRFLRHLKSYWEVHRHRIAPNVAEELDQLLESGQLTCDAGRIQTSQVLGSAVKVTFRQRRTAQAITIQVDRVINCTGANSDYRKLQHPLIMSLQKQCLVRCCSLGIDTARSGAVMNAKGESSSWLYTLGAARKGDLWETTAVPELRVQAQTLAETLLNSLSADEPISKISLPSKQSPPSQKLIFRQLFDSTSSTYTYLIADANLGQAILVDPVQEQVERDLRVLREMGLTLRLCLETHIHADHITGASLLRSQTGCQVIVPYHPQVTGADRWIRDNEILQLGVVFIRPIATPGHTDSHMAYLMNDTHLLTGDALFIRGCGRTDFQGGDAGMLYDVVVQELFKLPDDTLIYPGHDYQGQTVSTIGEERRLNPRFIKRDRTQFVEMMANLNLPYPQKIRVAVPTNQRCGASVESDYLYRTHLTSSDF